MVTMKEVSELIKAYKKWDHECADKIINNVIKKLEEEKKYKVAKDLRKVYAQPYSKILDNNRWSLWNSSLNSPTNDLAKSELYDFRKSNITLEDIVLSDMNQTIVKDIINNHHNKELFSNHNLDIKTRVLLYWPPWTWKTLFAYALAGQLWLPVMHIRLDQLISSYLWETGKNIRKIFEDASKSNCVIFLDEFDAVAKHRDDTTELWELKRVVTVLLQYIDNLNSNNILISATNHFHLLDSAIIRRFEYSINLWLLDKTALVKLYGIYLKNFDFKTSELKELAVKSEGISWATIRQMVDKATKKRLLEDEKDKTLLSKHILREVLIYQLKLKSHFLKENKKENKEDIKSIMKQLFTLNDKYTYKDFEVITGIPDSTLNDRLNEKVLHSKTVKND